MVKLLKKLFNSFLHIKSNDKKSYLKAIKYILSKTIVRIYISSLKTYFAINSNNQMKKQIYQEDKKLTFIN